MHNSQKPNIIFVLTDDQGYGDMGCHGNDVICTPNIDRLYRESIRFIDFHVGPTCAPSRAGLMTGHYHNSTGVWHTIGGRSLLRENEVTLASILRSNGYVTGIFGKWHLGDTYPYRPQDRGFDEAVIHGGGGIGQTPDYWGNDYYDDTYFNMGKPQKYVGYCTDVWFSLAREFIIKHRDMPFFCYISTNAPHTPLNVEEKYYGKYMGKVPQNRARFYGMIECIDENIGSLRDFLEHTGIAQNTIFIFMTDNGTADGCLTNDEDYVTEGYNAGMRGKKSSPYDGGHRVPFFLHWEKGGFNKGKDVEQLTANVDFMPTILELCGISLPEEFEVDGKSLVPLMYEQRCDWESRIIVTDSQRLPQPVKWKDCAIMKDKWRLVNGKELYNIEADPEQKWDISTEHLELVQEMRDGYEIWWKKVSKNFDEEIPLVIGAYTGETVLTSHDWRGDAEDCAWNQGEIRAGKVCNGHFEIRVENEGHYSFELRRWPREEDLPICEGIDGELTWYTGGRSIKIRKACLRIADFQYERDIGYKDKFIVFTANLKPGPCHLQTWLSDEDGNTLGAYYVYIKKL